MNILPTSWLQKPIQYIQQGAGITYSIAKAAFEVLNESRKMITHLITGGAFKFGNTRIVIAASNPMKDPFESLKKINGELSVFEQRQPTDAKNILPPIKIETPTPVASTVTPPNPVPALSSIPSPATPVTEPNPNMVIHQKAETDDQLQIFSKNLSSFLPLYTMAYLAGIKDPNLNQVVLSMVIEASKSDKPNLKKIFYQTYENKVSFPQTFLIWLFNLFGSSSYFSKTVDAYMKHILKEMRARLSDSRWTEKRENVERLIDDIILFLESYKCATFNYAEDKEPTGGLNHYRAAACDKMFQKSLKQISEEFSDTLINNLSPSVQYSEYKIVNWFLNKISQLMLRRFLPNGIHSVLLQTDDATKSHYLPFVKALTDSVAEQLQKLLKNLDTQEPSSQEETPIAGTQKLKAAIKCLFNIIQYSKSNTQEAILQKRKELEEKRKENNFDNDIQQGIQDSIFKGIHVFLHHLAEPANSEQMFTQFFANFSFSKGELITDKDYQDSKDKLNLIVHTVGKRLAKEAVEDRIRGSNPKIIEKNVNHAFASHKIDATTLMQGLEQSVLAITQKIQAFNLEQDSGLGILPELDQIVQTIRLFSTQEQIGKDLKNLPEAEQESILQALMPIYQSLEKISPLLLSLQEQQKLFKAQFQLQKELLEIDTIIQFLIHQGPSEQSLKRLSFFQEIIHKISKQLPPNAPEILKIKQELKTIESAFKKAFDEKQRYDYLILLQKELSNLNQAIKTENFNLKKTAIQKISKILENIPQKDANTLKPILNTFSSLTASDARFKPLSEQLETIIESFKTTYTQEKDTAFSNLPNLKEFQSWIQEKIKGYALHQKTNQENMVDASQKLSQAIQEINSLLHVTEKEQLFDIKPLHLGIIGGSALGVMALINPALALGLGAGAYMALKRIEPILKGGEQRKEALLTSLFTGASIYASSYVPAISNLFTTTGALTSWTKIAAVGGSALLGGKVATDVLDEAVSAGQSLVFEQITDFFESTYQFLLSGEIYQPSAKIAMQEVINAFKKT